MFHYIGMDLHKRTAYLAVRDASGQMVDQARVATSRETLLGFLKGVPKPFAVALEATRNWYWVYDLLEEEADEVKLCHPLKTRLIAEARIKTDRVDAKILADLLRTDYLPTCYVPGKETRQRRELLRHRAFLVRMRTRVKNRIHSLLDKAGVEHPFENLFGKPGLKFLKELSLPWAYKQELKDCLDLLEFLSAKEKQQNQIITKLCKETDDAKLLTSLPGFGYHNALLVCSEIDKVDRFPDGSHFASYCGLVTSVHISDSSVHYGHITGQGNSWLRWIFVEAAQVARRRSLRFGRLYQRVAYRSGPRQAIVAVAREMAVVTYYMLKYHQPFDDRR